MLMKQKMFDFIVVVSNVGNLLNSYICDIVYNLVANISSHCSCKWYYQISKLRNSTAMSGSSKESGVYSTDNERTLKDRYLPMCFYLDVIVFNNQKCW